MRRFPPMVECKAPGRDKERWFRFRSRDLSWLVNSILKIGDRKKAIELLKAHIEKGKP